MSTSGDQIPQEETQPEQPSMTAPEVVTEPAEESAAAEVTVPNSNGVNSTPETVTTAEVLLTDEQLDAMEHTDFYTKLLNLGFKKLTAHEVEKLVPSMILMEDDLDDRALNALKEFDVKHIQAVLKEFSSSDLSHVQNKSAYLCGMMKTYRQRLTLKEPTDTPRRPTVAPTEEQLAAILKSGYTLDITTGQRKYGGPPPNWEGAAPGAGHEVFIGRIPRELFEDTLVPVLEKAGQIWDFRLMIDSLTGFNRGYAFCTYCTKEAAKKAVNELTDYEVQPGKKLKVNISVANVRLFVGNIPKQKSKEEIKEEFAKLTEGLTDVIVYKPTDDSIRKNRGFAFLEYDSHKNASAAKRKLSTGRTLIWSNIDVFVDWADPQEEPSDEVMDKVKVLYVKGLLPDITEEMITERFEPYGKLERVKKLKDYAFVHFAEREQCMQALNDLNGQKIATSTLDITLAKPQGDKMKEKKRMRDQAFRGGPPGPPGFGGRGRGGPWGPPMRGGYGGPGGFGGGYGGDWGYGGGGGGYNDGWGYGGGFGGGYGGGYQDYGYGPPRGGPRGRGFGGRGGPPRGGGFGGRGGRGGPRGGNRGGPRGGVGTKRPMPAASGGPDDKKPKPLVPEQAWGAQPIAQQPLANQSNAGAAPTGGAQWYQDSW